MSGFYTYRPWIGNHVPHWPIRLNTASPQARGLILFCPPVPDLGLCRDLSPSQQHGAIGTDITLVGSPLGNTAFFQNNNDVVSNIGWTWATLVNLPTTHNFTVSSWAYKPVTASDDAIFAWNGTDDLVVYPNDTGASGGSRVFWRDMGPVALSDADAVATAQPQVLTFKSEAVDNHKFFRNGKLIDSATSTGTAGPFSSFEWLGWEGSNSQQLIGMAWWLRVWDRALSDAEIAAYDGDPAQWWDLAAPRRTFVAVPAAAGAVLAQTKTRVYTPGTYLG